MKKLILSILGSVMSIGLLQAQNDSTYMYVMKDSMIIGQYNISQVDSVIFYQPTEFIETTVTDIDGNTYTTRRIGTQEWMTQDLRTTRYSNGDLIGTTVPPNLDISTETDPKYQWGCNGSEGNAEIYGRLYTWYAIVDSRNVCPTGWHLPSDGEWRTLTDNLGGESVAGGKLKEEGTAHWSSPNTGATNEIGFTARPGGTRISTGSFVNFGNYGYWWTASSYNASFAWCLSMSYNNSSTTSSFSNKKIGYCVRCVR